MKKKKKKIDEIKYIKKVQKFLEAPDREWRRRISGKGTVSAKNY